MKSMFWADKLLEGVKGAQVINDSWTPSGMVHMGSLKGPVIHDTLFKILKERGQNVKFMYGFDDADPIDGLPSQLQESHSKYLGVPIYLSPSPDGKGTFGEYFGNKMKNLLDGLGIKPDEIYKTSELYKNGVFNKAITLVLDRASEIRRVYGEIYKKELPSTWYPMQVVCSNCGKLGTTKVTGWDGQKVTFACEENLVKWAKGCGFSGAISPYNGNGKMPWKVEWAAKWWTFGVTIEGAGKDHASAGGSYDVAMKLCLDIFKKETPLKIAYEFFLSGGKKMASSKGVGLTGEDLLKVLDPRVARFLMIKNPPNQAVEFTPRDTDIIPKLYADYQKAAGAFFSKFTKNRHSGETSSAGRLQNLKENGFWTSPSIPRFSGSRDQNDSSDLARVFELSQIGGIKKPPQVRFSILAQWVQMPNMQDAIKKEGLEEWAKYAKVWIEKYAPESEKFLVQKELPEEARNLSDFQKQYLQKIVSELDKKWDAEDFQKELYELAKSLNISSKDAFAAIYISLIGKNHGPKAAWLILSLDRNFIKNRFEEAVKINSSSHSGEHSDSRIGSWTSQDDEQDRMNIKPEIFSINSEIKSKFPSISIGVAIINGVNIQKINTDLEKEKNELLKSLDALSTEQLGKYPEIISYRKLYKETGIDWHSRRPSPEALLRRGALKKGLYTINTCVDAYNLVVMKNRISVGAFDLDKISFPTVLRFAKEGEEILLLGDDQPTKYEEGEIAYFDKNGGYNIDFNYRDAQRTAVQLDTKNLYINTEGIYDIPPQKVEQVLKEACDAIIKYCGGKLEVFGVETVA